MAPLLSSCAFARGQPWKANAQWCFAQFRSELAQFRQELGATPRGSPWLHQQPPPGDTAVARGCSSCPGTLPKKKVLQPQELAVMLGAAPSRVWPPMSGWLMISGCSSPSTGAPGAKLRGSISFFPRWTMAEHRELASHACPSPASRSHPRASHPGTSSHLTPKFCKHKLLSLLLHYFFASFGSWQELHRAISGLPPVAGWRKREERRSDHATSCSEGYCRHFYNIYNCTGHSVLQRFQKT